MRPYLVVLAAVLLVFLPGGFGAEFVSDDMRFIRDNPAVLAPDGLFGWLRFFTSPDTVDPANPQSIARPLRTLEFALDHAVFGLSPVAFRLHGLAWHALAAALCLALLRDLTGDARAALLGALVWALHPMQVESVAWISARADVATGAGVLAALVLELRSDGRDRALAAALLAGLAAMLFKETAVGLPLLVLAVRLVRPRGPPGLAQAARAALPYAALAAVYVAYRFAVQEGDTAHTDFLLGGSTAGTLSTMSRAFGAYVAMTLLPVDPAWDWYLTPTTSLLVPSSLAWLAVHVGAAVLAVRWRRSRPLLAAAIVLFYVPLLPVANWPFPLGIPTAERFLYLPLLGLGLLVAAALRRAPRAGVPVLACVVCLGALSAVRVSDWRTEDALFASSLAHGKSPRAFGVRAAALRELSSQRLDQRRFDQSKALAEEALDHAHRALAEWRRFEGLATSTSHVVVPPHREAAAAARFLKRHGEALWHAERAIAAGEDLFADTHYSRAAALLHFRRGAAALRSMQRAVELGGYDAEAPWFRTAFLEAGRHCEDLEQWELAREAYRAAGDEARAAAVERRVTEIVAGEDRFFRLAALLGDGRLDDAEDLARDVPGARTDPNLIVRVHAYRGVPAGWQAALDELTALAPPRGRTLFWMAVCLEELGRDTEAADAYRQWLATGAEPATPPTYDAEERARQAIDRIKNACPAWRSSD